MTNYNAHIKEPSNAIDTISTEIYIPFDKKYRPKTFDEIVGQKIVLGTLKQMVETNKIPSSILIVGPYGTGKTSLARLIAKYINCKNNNGTVCTDEKNLCKSCSSIVKGNPINIIEINAANARGIDEVRALIDESKYAPLGGKKKVFICDEVHQWTNQAAQAMLKPLEEPPPKTIWILCTTEPQKISKIIRSRCTILNLKTIPTEDIIKTLKYICTKEKRELPDTILNTIASMSQGHARDAVIILEQILLYTERHGVEDDLANNIMTVFDSLSSIPPEILAKKYVHALLSNPQQSFDLLRRTENHRFLLTLIIQFIKNLSFYLIGTKELLPPNFDKLLTNMSGMKPFNVKDLTYLLELHLDVYERTKDYDMNILDIFDLTVLKYINYQKTK